MTLKAAIAAIISPRSERVALVQNRAPNSAGLNNAIEVIIQKHQTETAILIQKHQAETAGLQLLIDKLTFELGVLKRLQFGQRSEAMSLVVDDLFDPTCDQVNPNPPLPKPSKTSREPKPAPRPRLPKDLPVEATTLDLPQAQRYATDGSELVCIGEDISDKLACVPSQFFIRRVIYKKYASPALPELGIKTGRTRRVCDGMLSDESLLADVLVKKYDDHLPLNRISEIYYRDAGVCLPKQTLSDWVIHSANWLQPVAAAILAWMLENDDVIHVDETILPLLRPIKTLKARAWAYVGANSGLIYYDFSLDKAGHHVRTRLAGWNTGSEYLYLQADAASNYDALYQQRPNIQEVACWSHARRKFFDIAKQSPTAKTAHEALARINALFEIERKAKEAKLEGADLLSYRQEHAKPKLDSLKKWLEAQLREIQPRSPTAGAIGYALNHWDALMRYLDHAHCRIDNNAAERALRVVAQGRKSWLFAGSENGGAAAAVAYTLIESAKACGHNPREYLEDLLRRLPTTLQKNIDQLLPHCWTPPSKSA